MKTIYFRRIVSLLLLFTAACGRTPANRLATETPVQQTPPPGQTIDANTGKSDQSSGGDTPSAPAPSQTADVPPLYFFYVNHTHLDGDHWPYTDASLTTIDTNVADNMLFTIEGISELLDRYGVKASWEVVYGTAQGLCSYEGETHIFQRLTAAGHEMGLHVHSAADYDRDYDALHDVCGLTPTITSGLLLAGGMGNPQAGAATGIQTNLDLGIHVATIGFGHSRLVRNCQGELGERGQALAAAGVMLFPWRPDWQSGDLCSDNPQARFAFVDHLDMETWTGAKGNQQADLLTDADFDRLRAQLDTALTFMDNERPQQIAAWGFVTHPMEFMVENQGENGPDPASLAALEHFLAYVDEQHAQGRIIYATASEIANLAFSGQ